MQTVTGPNGEVRPTDTRANASLVARILTGEATEKVQKSTKRPTEKPESASNS